MDSEPKIMMSIFKKHLLQKLSFNPDFKNYHLTRSSKPLPKLPLTS